MLDANVPSICNRAPSAREGKHRSTTLTLSRSFSSSLMLARFSARSRSSFSNLFAARRTSAVVRRSCSSWRVAADTGGAGVVAVPCDVGAGGAGVVDGAAAPAGGTPAVPGLASEAVGDGAGGAPFAGGVADDGSAAGAAAPAAVGPPPGGSMVASIF